MGDKNKQWHGGKGSERRSSDEKSYSTNYDKIDWNNNDGRDESDDLEDAKRVEIEEDHDTMPDVEVLEKIVKKELKKLEPEIFKDHGREDPYSTESEKMQAELEPIDNISWEGSEFWKGRDKIESNISYDIPVQPDDNPSDIEKDYDEPVANTYTRPQNTYPEPTTGG